MTDMTRHELPIALKGCRFPIGTTIKQVRANHLHIVLPNGVTISATWAPGTYSDNRDVMTGYRGSGMDVGDYWSQPRDATTVEIAMWDAAGEHLAQRFEGGDDQVIGYADAETVQSVVDWAVTHD